MSLVSKSVRLLRSTALFGALIVLSPIAVSTPAFAQGVPPVDAQNIAQNIQQLRQMIEDELLQNEQLLQLREQLATLTDQLAELQRTYEALTRLAELPEIIRTEMEEELNGLLDQEFGDIIATIEAIRTGDFSGLTGSGASEIETQMDRVLADLGFDEDTLAEMARSGNPGAERIATQATTGALVSAAAQNSYDDAGQSLERVERLVGLIDDKPIQDRLSLVTLIDNRHTKDVEHQYSECRNVCNNRGTLGKYHCIQVLCGLPLLIVRSPDHYNKYLRSSLQH